LLPQGIPEPGWAYAANSQGHQLPFKLLNEFGSKQFLSFSLRLIWFLIFYSQVNDLFCPDHLLSPGGGPFDSGGESGQIKFFSDELMNDSHFLNCLRK